MIAQYIGWMSELYAVTVWPISKDSLDIIIMMMMMMMMRFTDVSWQIWTMWVALLFQSCAKESFHPLFLLHNEEWEAKEQRIMCLQVAAVQACLNCCILKTHQTTS